MPSANKLLVTNVGALKAKYAKKYPKVEEAIEGLIKADAKREIITKLIALDDAAEMKRFKAQPITDLTDQEETKDAIDKVWKAHDADYLAILGAPDIVTHQNLLNPVYAPLDDDDLYVPSDLPYACDAPYSKKQDIADFRGPTRVVGRIPDLCGLGDASYFVKVLHTATTYKNRQVADYMSYFGLSTQSWQNSTKLSLENIFGKSDALHRSPPQGPAWRRSQLDALSHFINCHGDTGKTSFWGERGDSQPVAMDSEELAKKIRRGTIVSAECCYGAQLFAPSIPEEMGICNRYLSMGAYAFFGSSTIAYGPSEGNSSADWICQFFIERVLNGASTGRAALEARIGFIWFATTLDPTDLKTIAQFNLMGDPSITAVGKPKHKLQKTMIFFNAFDRHPETVARSLRRKRLRRQGLTLENTIGAARGARQMSASAKIGKVLERSLRNAKLKPGAAASYTVDDPAQATLGAKIKDTKPAEYHLMQGSAPPINGGRKRHAIVVATVMDDEIVRLRRLHRRG
jgi:hypothetical protein